MHASDVGLPHKALDAVYAPVDVPWHGHVHLTQSQYVTRLLLHRHLRNKDSRDSGPINTSAP